MGPKKGKKSKAELEEEKLAKEEEERKARILEEKKAAEEREKRRQEELKFAAEQKALREAEIARLTEEFNEILDDLKTKDQQLAAEERNEENKLEWIKYRDPTDDPRATSERDINTFITAAVETQVNDTKEAIEWVKKIEKLANDVEDLWSVNLAKKNYKMLNKLFNNLKVFREMIIEKLDQGTIPLLRFSDKYVNDRVELFLEEMGNQVGMGIWASYNDIRPIRKSVQWEQLGVQLDIPKQLLQQNEKYVYRVTRTPIVTYNLEPYLNPTSPVLPQQVVQSDSNNSQAVEETKVESTTSTNLQVEGEGKNDGEETTSPPGEEENKESKDETVKEAPSSAPTQIPPVNAWKSSKKFVVGDLINFDILLSPSQAYLIRAKKWTIRDKSSHSTNIRKSSYPSSVACRMFIKVPDGVIVSDDMRIAIWNEDVNDWVEDGISDYQYNEATRIIQFYITTTGTLALVKQRTSDMPLKSWSIYPVLIKPVNSLMTYSKDSVEGQYPYENALNDLIGLSLVKQPHSSLPLTYERHARLQIETKQHSLVIDIVGTRCILIKPEISVFNDIRGKLFTPGVLLKRLQRKGIHLLPTDEDLLSSKECHFKRRTLEEEAWKQIGASVSAVEFKSSEWNSTLNESQIGFLARESTIYVCPNEGYDYECIIAERDEISISYHNTPELGFTPGSDGIKYLLVYGNEYGTRKHYSTIARPNEVTHLDVASTLRNRIVPEAMNRIKRTNPSFQKTVYTLLSLIKPYSQS